MSQHPEDQTPSAPDSTSAADQGATSAAATEATAPTEDMGSTAQSGEPEAPAAESARAAQESDGLEAGEPAQSAALEKAADGPTEAAASARGPQDAKEPEGAVGGYHVVLPAFEGPLDLLLHLIQQHELDIADIPIAFVSEKYVEYITLMQDLNIDLASEYLVMAATLAHIKSKMLLPTPPTDQEDEADLDLDPRAELVRRLLEYQKYKRVAEQLGQSSVLGRDVFVRGAPAPSVEGPAPLAQVSVFKLFDAFQGILKRVKQTAEHLIDVDRISISERINELTDMLRGRERVRFDELFDGETTRSDLVVTFLALLEMTRLRMTRVLQEGPLEPIFIELSWEDVEREEREAAQIQGDLNQILGAAGDGFDPRPEGDNTDSAERQQGDESAVVDAAVEGSEFESSGDEEAAVSAESAENEAMAALEAADDEEAVPDGTDPEDPSSDAEEPLSDAEEPSSDPEEPSSASAEDRSDIDAQAREEEFRAESTDPE